MDLETICPGENKRREKTSRERLGMERKARD